ncbi:MAG TPA: RimK/LysX family protein [Candidatus Nanoarchaeia archaeon]|nr:RimK/LysX family protein [Candidatus Nanoarchaeia archaeon]
MVEKYKGSVVIGLTEKVTIMGKVGKKKSLIAKIDSGATKSSMDARLAAQLQLGPIIQTKLVKSAHGNSLRAVIEAELYIADRHFATEFTLADRIHMKYHVLIGQNILKQGFVIDPRKK